MAGGPGPVTNCQSRRAFTPRRDSPTDRRDGRRLSPGMRPGRVRPQRTTARIAQPAPVSHGLDGLRRHNTTGMPPPSRRATWPANHRRRPAPRHDRHDLEAMDGLRCHTRQACCPTTDTPTPRRDRRGSQATDASAATARGMAEWTGVRHDDTTTRQAWFTGWRRGVAEPSASVSGRAHAVSRSCPEPESSRNRIGTTAVDSGPRSAG